MSARAAAIEGSEVGLRAGEQLRADDLLTAMLVRSGNDACLALVEHAAGSIDGFVPRLKARAAVLGMAASNILHPWHRPAMATVMAVSTLTPRAVVGSSDGVNGKPDFIVPADRRR